MMIGVIMLNDFKNYLKLHVDSPNGQLQYWHRMKLFFKSHKEFNQETINKFLADCVDQKLKPSTFNGYMTALKHYSRFKKIEIEFPKQKRTGKKNKDFLTLKELEEEIIPYFNLLFPSDSEKRKLIIRFMFTSGLRPAEVVKLNKEDIDFEDNTIYVKEPKDKDDRKSYLNKEIVTDMQKQINRSPNNSVFNVTQGYITYIFTKINEELMYKKRLTPYVMRHSCCHHAVRSGMDIRELQKMMGHWNIQMTAEYLELTDDEIKHAYEKKFKFTKGKKK